MMYLYDAPHKKDTVYRYVGGDDIDGILSCGWLPKKTAAASQIDFTIPYYSCFILLQGSGSYSDTLGNQCELSAGCLVQRLPDVTHSTQVYEDGKWLEFYISFGRSTYLSLVRLGVLSQESPVKKCLITSETLSGFAHLLSQMKSAPDTALFQVLLHAQQQAVNLQLQKQEFSSKQELISRACLLLEEQLHKDISAREIAAQLSIGYESFRKLFKEYTQFSPHEYRRLKKMMSARMMLLGGLTVKATAQELGYSDDYTFSKQFKLCMGMSPSQYARQEAEKSL